MRLHVGWYQTAPYRKWNQLGKNKSKGSKGSRYAGFNAQINNYKNNHNNNNNGMKNNNYNNENKKQ